ncbi:MAG: 4Fe-4S ferredoxin [Verrucomicrobia bacterium]|jgi:NAD-dependent dihydropyrimidine dehydrogenase PreA subunit|nr:4Fe-4S ferredoxin [Verrucomicrobiota bacterium]
MAKRKIIEIDEAKCNGCGNCITGCAEGALQLVDGKARLVKEQFCDGFGDCIGTCPTGALTIIERESEEFDVEATRQNLYITQGEEAVRRMDSANEAHDRGEHPTTPTAPQGGCPGTRMRMPSAKVAAAVPTTAATQGGQMVRSDLEQWPVQLHLVQPGAPFFDNKELVILSTCAPVASADVHWRFLRGRSVVVACPKLDNTDPYVDKLTGILQNTTIPKAIVVRMEVPCCGGLSMMAKEALQRSGRNDLVVEEVTVGLTGDILSSQTIGA